MPAYFTFLKLIKGSLFNIFFFLIKYRYRNKIQLVLAKPPLFFS